MHLLSLDSYLAAVQRGEAERVGRAVLELFRRVEEEQGSSSDDEEEADDDDYSDVDRSLLRQVREIVAAARDAIRTAQRNADEHGQIDVRTGERAGDGDAGRGGPT